MIESHTCGMVPLPQEAIVMSKVTISISEKLLQVLDDYALDWNTTRSGAVAEMIRRIEKEKLEAELALGYAELAELNKEEANLAFTAQVEAIVNDKAR